MAAFDWDTLLDFIIQDRSVVPVIGQELLGSAARDLRDKLAGDGAAGNGMADGGVADGVAPGNSGGTNPGEPVDLRRAFARALALRPQSADDDPFRRVTVAHRDWLAAAAVPEALRALAEVSDFSLFLTTTPDGLLARALREGRRGEIVVRTASVENFDDLPAQVAPDATLLYHLLGRWRGMQDFACHDGDVLDFVHRLHDREVRPPGLFRRLKESHLLLIGQTFPDWLARVLLRLLRDRPVAARASVFSALAGQVLHTEPNGTFVLFLREFSPQTLVYTEGDAAHFATELHRRWQERRGQAVAPVTVPAMKPGAIFISYARADGAAAEKIATLLAGAGLDAWFDRTALVPGDAYASVIRKHIRECDLFIPLLSGGTEARPEEGAFFRREWEWAVARLEADKRFICPLVVDPAIGGIRAMRAVPKEFLDLHIASAPGGQLDDATLHALVETVRERRNLRVAAA